MTKQSVEQEIAALRDQIREHDRRYYVDAAPSISDLEYDKLFARLKELEAAHPELVTPDSPTQRVGGEPLERFKTVTHARPMYSIENTYNFDGLRKWAANVFKVTDATLRALSQKLEVVGKRGGKSGDIQRRELREKYDAALAAADDAGFPIAGGYIVDPKVDGIAINLRYEDSILTLAATRGDGQRGDDVTQNVRAISAIPLVLCETKKYRIPSVLEVRGEIYMPTAEFDRINRTVVEVGSEPFANPRNATAGTLKSLDSKVVKSRRLRFCAYGRGEISERLLPIFTSIKESVEQFPAHSEFLSALRAWGIPTNPIRRKCTTIDEVADFIKEFAVTRVSLPYGTDGVVVRVDRIDLQEQLGYTSRFPRWCVAYKYAAEQAETKLLKVDWQVGKTGKLTPRATMEPVLLAGTTVRHATLHNLGEIRRKDIRIGDSVVIEKAGEIIPQVVRVVIEKRPTTSRHISPPKVCPECGGEVEADFANRENGEDETSRFCINPECPAQFRERLIYFAGRNQMNIEGLGEELVDQLLKSRLVMHLADLYTLTEDQLAGLTHKSVTKKGKEVDVRLGEIKARQIVASLERSKSRGLTRVLASINIRHIGTQTARVVASKVKNIEELLIADEEFVRSTVWDSEGPSKLKSVKKAASAFYEALHSPEGTNRIAEAKAAAKRSVSLSEVMFFLTNLPEGPKWGRVKWGMKDSPGAGRGKKDRILQRFGTLDELFSCHIHELVELFDDEVVGRSLFDFLHSKYGRETIERLRNVGVDMSSHTTKTTLVGGTLTGKTFVVTGTLQKYSREEVHELIRSHGGKTTSSVSSITDFVLAGENPGSKLDAAQKLGITTLNEAEFESLITGT